MKHPWTKHRVLLEHPDGLHRWDRAYQLLMLWSVAPTPNDPPEPSDPNQLQEDHHAGQCVCASIDAASSSKPND
jgi:hypothetical protein